MGKSHLIQFEWLNLIRRLYDICISDQMLDIYCIQYITVFPHRISNKQRLVKRCFLFCFIILLVVLSVNVRWKEITMIWRSNNINTVSLSNLKIWVQYLSNENNKKSIFDICRNKANPQMVFISSKWWKFLTKQNRLMVTKYHQTMRCHIYYFILFLLQYTLINARP
jgi:hypothetical protein